VTTTTTAGSIAGPGNGAADPIPDTAPASTSPRPRTWLIFFAIATTAALCVLTIALLYLRWWRNDAHNSIIAVWIDERWDGAIAEVSDPAIQLKLEHPLTRDGDMLARFHVPPGLYKVRITKDNKVLDERPPHVMQPSGVWWPFRAPPGAAELGLTR
jgi:hypothetical protein